MCTSPEFVAPNLATELMDVVSAFMAKHHGKAVPSETLSRCCQGEKSMEDEISGIYDDDGTKVEPETVPKPSLCVT